MEPYYCDYCDRKYDELDLSDIYSRCWKYRNSECGCCGYRIYNGDCHHSRRHSSSSSGSEHYSV